MIIEFIGSTGTGKTTLIKEIRRRLAKTTKVTSSIDLITGLIGLRGVTNPTVQNLIQEIICFPYFLCSLHRNKAFILYTIRLFSRYTRFSLRTINNLRSLERKIGGCEIIRAYKKDRVILVDEGPILAAHMFAYTDASVTPEEINKFAGLVPIPDVVVYVKAPPDAIVRRTLARSDPPREINSKNQALIEKYTKSAITIFDQLVKTENLQDRIIHIENSDFAEQEYDKLAGYLTEMIRKNKTLIYETN